ncbi:hypothetical protein LZG00_01550 [Rhodobacteraceae bacterium LMO-12]|nr:hypothetical protein [Rhodobacteraceae bacterium LMO-JJ12]
MNRNILLRGGFAIMACAALVGCSNGSTPVAGGGGGGGGGGTAAFDAALSNVQHLGPQTEKQIGTSDYSGQAKVETVDNASGVKNGYIIGDVDLTANWDAETVSGSATNFQGEYDGNPVTLDGTLTTAASSSPNTVVQQTIALPVGGTITTGNLIANLRGTLTESINNESSDVELGMIGSFTGANAEGAQGAATMLVGDSDSVGFAIAGGGQFYLEKN